MDQEVTSKLSHIIVSGVLYGHESNDHRVMEKEPFQKSVCAAYSLLHSTVVVGFLESLKLMKEALTHQPYIDWILACISISKPKVILTKLLYSGFGVFVKNDSSDAKREHLRALTCILEYLGLFQNSCSMYLIFRFILDKF